MKRYEALVIGGGHAGIEATFALANKGHKVALITLDKNKVAMMPCNPAIGGPAKGIITREIDALGGMQGIFSDQAMIQIKMLNESKGPAVKALRAQIDKDKYSKIVLEELEKNSNISIIEAMVNDILVENNKIIGVELDSGEIINSNISIITTGTYMDSFILRGKDKTSSGPDGQKTSTKISESLKKLGFNLQRLKTGTPPRVFSNSIDFSEVEEEVLDNSQLNFSSRSGIKLDKQTHCYITYTNNETHKIVDSHVNESSMYSGAINGIGPRYCPSIEDKIVRFRDKDRHQIFYEPETKNGDIIYVNGLSTSMPIYVQEKMLKTLPGMKNAKVQKWAYAIEYDAIDPLQVKSSLESKDINGLFFAGQVNGTSGYEEAAGQGLIAGINAGQKLENKEPIILQRDEAYIGVLIDDLTTKGTKEPYRMLTSRAEYRLLLRNDNADKRLSKTALKAEMISTKEFDNITSKYKSIDLKIKELENKYLSSKDPLAIKHNITKGPSMTQVLSRPEVDYKDVSDFKYMYEVWVKVRLKGYIKKQETEAKKMKRLEKLKLPNNIKYSSVQNLATEAKQKLEKIKPTTIGQASRISGINPADIQMLMFHLEHKNKVKNET